MGYIGNTPAEKYTTFAKQTFTPDSSTVAFTLDYPVANENDLELFVNNVRQEPGSGKAYTAGGTTLTMSEAPTSGHDMYVIFQGKAQQTTTATLPIVDLTVTNTGTITTTTDTPSLTVNNTNDGKARITLEENGNPRLDIGLFGGVVSGTSGATVIKAYEPLIFHDNSGETFRSQSGQILLGTTSEGSAAAGDVVLGGGIFIGGNAAGNKLDDYEEGTFTPALEGTSGSAGSVAYTDRVGYYVKIGPIVHIQLRMVMSNLGSWGGNMYVSGLPFVVANEGAPPPMSLEIRKVTLGNYGVFAACSDGSTNLYLKEYVSGNDPARITISDLASNSVWIVNGTYRTTA